MSRTRWGSIAITAAGLGALSVIAWFAYNARLWRAPVAAAPRPALSAALPPEPPFAPPISQRGRRGEVFLLPATCPAGAVDAVLHFHGAEPAMLKSVTQAQLRAALFVSNQGVSSDGYRDAYRDAATFSRVLSDLEAQLAKHCGGSRSLGRVALSSWSAGFAALSQLLREDATRQRVDAVLLADSLHAAFIDPAQRRIGETQLQGFVAFAQAAAQGRKLMLVTHSSIQTDAYASTTETADFLLAAIGTPRSPASDGGSTAQVAGFRLWGRPGMDEQAHVQELKAFGTLLYPALVERWRSARQAAGR